MVSKILANGGGGIVKWSMGAARVALLCCVVAGCAAAQAVVEYGNVSSAVGAGAIAAASQHKALVSPPNEPAPTQGETTQGGADVASNRKQLESRAGKDAAKLMLRSIPGEAWVRIDDKPVGTTPLLLIVAPGVYSVEMEGGPRRESARRQVDLLPKETREVVLTLQSRYPARVRMQARSSR